MTSDAYPEQTRRWAGARLEYDAWGRLVLCEADGQRHVGVDPIRAFPLTDRDHGIAFVDSEGLEVAWIDDLRALPVALRDVIVEELSRREFMPVIERIISVSAHTDPAQWHVRTDRGTTRFLVRSEDDLRRIGSHGAILVDAAGMRYLVPDTRRLDAAGRRVLERYM